MYFNDDYPCARCPYNEVTYGHCDYDEYCRYEDEEREQACYLDEECDLPSVIVQKPWSSEDLSDLPF